MKIMRWNLELNESQDAGRQKELPLSLSPGKKEKKTHTKNAII